MRQTLRAARVRQMLIILSLHGWGLKPLSQVTGVSSDALGDIRRGETHSVHWSTYDAVMRSYFRCMENPRWDSAAMQVISHARRSLSRM